MIARFAAVIFLGAALGAAAQDSGPEPLPAPAWRMQEFDLMSQYRTRPVASGFVLLMMGAPGSPSTMFECANDQIFATIAPNGDDPRTDLGEQWSNGASRPVRWAVSGGDWSRQERWVYYSDLHTFRPVDIDTRIAMWEAAKAGGSFALLYRNEETSLQWPQPNDEMAEFIEACGWADN